MNEQDNIWTGQYLNIYIYNIIRLLGSSAYHWLINVRDGIMIKINLHKIMPNHRRRSVVEKGINIYTVRPNILVDQDILNNKIIEIIKVARYSFTQL